MDLRRDARNVWMCHLNKEEGPKQELGAGEGRWGIPELGGVTQDRMGQVER